MFSGVLSIGKIEMTDEIPTACTNGRDVKYNPEFINTLEDKELNFVVLHEALHKVYQHMHMWKKLFKQNPQLTNMAADYVVNYAIYEADQGHLLTAMPQGGLFDHKYANMTTKQIFDLLHESGEQPQQGHDEHDWEGAQEMTEEEVKITERQIDQALRQGEIIRGKMEGNQNRAIQEILKPKVNWREQLRDFVTAICKSKDVSSWKRPHRRFIGQDVYMPSMIGESIGKIAIAIDTSASISEKEINMFLSEVVGVCNDVNPDTVELLYWDTIVAGHETYEQGNFDNLFESTKPKGGGGTHVACVNEYLQAERMEPEVVLVLTDGYVEEDWGGVWKSPVLWAVTTDMQAPHGKTINIKEN
tara:strand:+ start:140 stop:1216 length:1077 start_codon:yes stop_codon:yes gene_type:complete